MWIEAWNRGFRARRDYRTWIILDVAYNIKQGPLFRIIGPGRYLPIITPLASCNPRKKILNNNLLSTITNCIIECRRKQRVIGHLGGERIMGPCDYSDMVIATRLSDGKGDSKAPGCETVVIAWIMLCVSFPIVILMGLFVWKYIGLIAGSGLIGLGFWACGHYGTNNSLWRRLRYRPTASHCAKIRRRLSEGKK